MDYAAHVANLKFGKQPAKVLEGHPRLAEFVTHPYVAAPEPFDNGAGVALEMDGNGPDPTVTNHGSRFKGVGDCGFVGAVNARRISRARIIAAGVLAAVESLALPDANEVVAEYLAYNHGVDQGVNLVDFLEYWRTVGFFGSTILAHAKIDHTNHAELYGAARDFDVAYTGIQVPATMMGQVQSILETGAGVLDLTGTSADTDFVGGHCVDVSALLPSGNGKIDTWALQLEFTEAWRANVMDEAHVIITPEMVAAKGDGLNLDLDALVAKCDALGSAS